jgi:hypothetical protein
MKSIGYAFGVQMHPNTQADRCDPDKDRNGLGARLIRLAAAADASPRRWSTWGAMPVHNRHLHTLRSLRRPEEVELPVRCG